MGLIGFFVGFSVNGGTAIFVPLSTLLLFDFCELFDEKAAKKIL